MKPRLLDLFCGAGGCSVGYARAGFQVVGVDIEPQPNYPFRFWEHDALMFLQLDSPQDVASNFDAIHASPPCQGYTTMSQRWADTQAALPKLIAETRQRLQATGLPYVIENVPGARAHMVNPVQICGLSLGLGVSRHRLFETNFPIMVPPCSCGSRESLPVYGKLDGRRLWTRKDGSELRAPKTLEEAQVAMGIDWMEWDELREAISPAYTEVIGDALMAHLESERKAAA